MIFKNQIKRGNGILRRGDRCLYRTTQAWYMGSFKNEDDVHWNHMLLIQSNMMSDPPCVEEFVLTTTDTRDIVFRKMMIDNPENQLQLC